jgi:hypothetical protein
VNSNPGTPHKTSDSKFKIKRPRIGNVDVEKFHGYLVDEAIDIEFGMIPVKNVAGVPVDNVYLPSSFNYIILKLHAFRDRITDETVDLGRHHAFDIFSAVIDIDKSDWENAQTHYEMKAGALYIESAREIITRYFSTSISLGIIRIKENELYKRYHHEFDPYINEFIADLLHLFKIS